MNVDITGTVPNTGICYIRGDSTTYRCLVGGSCLTGGTIPIGKSVYHPRRVVGRTTSVVISGPPCIGATSVSGLRDRLTCRPGTTLSNNTSNLFFCGIVTGG